MKRSPELRDLSEEHHYGLVAARALRLAAEGNLELAAAVEEFLRTWETEIQPHFQSEEAVLLPEFARVAGDDHPLIIQTLVQHVRLRRLVRELAEPGPARPETAAEVARELHDHIRFEERQLFPAIEAALAGDPLAALGVALHAPVGRVCSLRTGGAPMPPAPSTDAL